MWKINTQVATPGALATIPEGHGWGPTQRAQFAPCIAAAQALAEVIAFPAELVTDGTGMPYPTSWVKVSLSGPVAALGAAWSASGPCQAATDVARLKLDEESTDPAVLEQLQAAKDAAVAIIKSHTVGNARAAWRVHLSGDTSAPVASVTVGIQKGVEPD